MVQLPGMRNHVCTEENIELVEGTTGQLMDVDQSLHVRKSTKRDSGTLERISSVLVVLASHDTGPTASKHPCAGRVFLWWRAAQKPLYFPRAQPTSNKRRMPGNEGQTSDQTIAVPEKAWCHTWRHCQMRGHAKSSLTTA